MLPKWFRPKKRRQCNCISKYVDDIHEFFPAVENYREVSAIEFHFFRFISVIYLLSYSDRLIFIYYFSSCTVLQQAECVSPIVMGWDWTTSYNCPEACFSQFYIQKDIQVF